MSAGKKYDSGKPQLRLIPHEVVHLVVGEDKGSRIKHLLRIWQTDRESLGEALQADYLADRSDGYTGLTAWEYGMSKYNSEQSWRNVPNALSRYFDALLRHLVSEGDDSESHLSHIELAQCNRLMLLVLLGHTSVTDADVCDHPRLYLATTPHAVVR